MSMYKGGQNPRIIQSPPKIVQEQDQPPTVVIKEQDKIAGFIRIMPKWSTEKAGYVDSGLFEIFIYAQDNEGNPIVQGYKVSKKDGKKYPQYKIAVSFTTPISTMTKVVSKEAFRSPIFQKKPVQRGY